MNEVHLYDNYIELMKLFLLNYIKIIIMEMISCELKIIKSFNMTVIKTILIQVHVFN